MKITPSPNSNTKALNLNHGGSNSPAKKPQKTEEKQERFYSHSFAELKKLNQKIATIQGMQASLTQIQKELGELQRLNNDLQYKGPNSDLLHKIQDLQEKIKPLLNLKANPKLSTKQELKSLQNSLLLKQKQLDHALEQESKKLEGFFDSHPDVPLQKEMLKKERFALAHDASKLPPSPQSLLL